MLFYNFTMAFLFLVKHPDFVPICHSGPSPQKVLPTHTSNPFLPKHTFHFAAHSRTKLFLCEACRNDADQTNAVLQNTILSVVPPCTNSTRHLRLASGYLPKHCLPPHKCVYSATHSTMPSLLLPKLDPPPYTSSTKPP